jgi:hypothetical protein
MSVVFHIIPFYLFLGICRSSSLGALGHMAGEGRINLKKMSILYQVRRKAWKLRWSFQILDKWLKVWLWFEISLWLLTYLIWSRNNSCAFSYCAEGQTGEKEASARLLKCYMLFLIKICNFKFHSEWLLW